MVRVEGFGMLNLAAFFASFAAPEPALSLSINAPPSNNILFFFYDAIIFFKNRIISSDS